MTDLKEGQYYYQRHKNKWGVWKKGKDDNGVSLGQFISDFDTQVQASNFVKRMNGWK